jgi:hypothetical protein
MGPGQVSWLALARAVLLVGWATIAGVLIRRRRHRLSEVIWAPSAIPVRLSLVVAVGGLAMLTGALPVLFVQSAIIAWELAVQVKAWVRRRRKSAA